MNFKKNNIRYFENGMFSNVNRSGNAYQVTLEYEQSLHKQVNEYPSDEDVARIVADIDGKPIFKVIDVDLRSTYRRRRNRECFPIINRGNAWYNTLTSSQKLDLDKWYKDWLEVTVTLVEPIKPKWLK